MGWVGNEGVDKNWNISPVTSPVTLSSHRGEFQEIISLEITLMPFFSDLNLDK